MADSPACPADFAKVRAALKIPSNFVRVRQLNSFYKSIALIGLGIP
jgi:hypothetical protein